MFLLCFVLCVIWVPVFHVIYVSTLFAFTFPDFFNSGDYILNSVGEIAIAYRHKTQKNANRTREWRFWVYFAIIK